MQQRGFTLIELMITVAIIAIIAAIAYPSYQESVKRTRRAVAKADLMELANFMERKFTENNTYASVALPSLGTEHYTVSFSSEQPTATTYVIQAAPTGVQASDSCGTLTISNTGATTPSSCW